MGKSQVSSRIETENRITSQPSGSALSFWILLLVSLLATIPVWVPAYPPMSDLPQHAAQVALLRDLQNSHFAYAKLFQLNWFTPYLLGYLLIYAITPLLGIVAACKMVISLYIAGLPLSTALLLESAGTDIFWAILCIPGAYGFTYQWGFLNFLIAAPLGILFLWYVLRSSQKLTMRTALLLAVFAIGLFFCHALICAFFGLCAVLCLLAGKRPLKSAILQILPLSAVVPVALLWMRTTLDRNAAARRPMIWDLNWQNTVESYYQSLSDELHMAHAGWGRITGFFPRLLGLHPSWYCIFLGTALFLLPLLAGMRLQQKRIRWIPFFLCAVVLLWCPHAVFGTEFVYQRFTMFAVPLFLFLLRESSTKQTTQILTRLAALLLVLGCIASATQKARAFSRETEGFQHALAYMQPGERVLSLAFDHEDGISIAPTFLHFPQWYAAQKQGFVDPSAAMMHPELVIFRKGEAPEAVLWDFEWDPEEFVWDDYSGEQYRYFVVRSGEDKSATLFAQAPHPVKLLFHQDDWWLYEYVDPDLTAPAQ